MSTVAPPEDDLQVPVPELLGKLLEMNGSDLHLTAGTPPTVRIHGELEQLGLPPVCAALARFPRGFVVVTGPTGSGKSTTLAGMVDVVNRERSGHIMTVEDPIEF